MEIYVELFLLDNIALNCIILFLCKRLLSDEKHILWLLCSAVVGALYALFMPLLSILESLPCKALLACAMVLIAFRCKGVKRFFKSLLCFMGSTFLAIGSAMGIYYLSGAQFFTENGLFYTNEIAIRGSIYALAAIMVFSKSIMKLLQKRHINGHILAVLEIVTQQGSTQVSALIDSGNTLIEKHSGLPVAVVQRSSITSILPDALKSIYEGNTTEKQTGILLIPYSSLGKRQGVLMGFIPQQVKIIRESQSYDCSCAIGICEEPLSNEGSYSAILHPLMLKEAQL